MGENWHVHSQTDMARFSVERPESSVPYMKLVTRGVKEGELRARRGLGLDTMHCQPVCFFGFKQWNSIPVKPPGIANKGKAQSFLGKKKFTLLRVQGNQTSKELDHQI